MVSIKEIFIYPIKGCGGIRVEHWPLDGKGLLHDRQWMLIDEHHRFVSQRELPQMALLQVSQQESFWKIMYPGATDHLLLPMDPLNGNPQQVTIWDDEVTAFTYSEVADSFFSHVLKRPVELVFFGAQSHRRVDPRFSPTEHQTRFSDGYPVLILGTASLSHLNTLLTDPIHYNRFRPNIVLQTEVAHIEDQWLSLQHADFALELVKPCARCVVTTIDQITAQKSPEPLKTLSTYRKFGQKINFGMNALVELKQPQAAIRIGQELLAAERQ